MDDSKQIEQVLLDNWGWRVGRLPAVTMSKMLALVRTYGHDMVIEAISKSAEYEQSKWNYAYVKGICEKRTKEAKQQEARSKQLAVCNEKPTEPQRGQAFTDAIREAEEVLGIKLTGTYKPAEKATDKLRKMLGK